MPGKALVKHMLGRGGGSVVNIVSVTGIALAVLDFVSPAASWVSGKILDVDGMAWPEFIPKNVPDLG